MGKFDDAIDRKHEQWYSRDIPVKYRKKNTFAVRIILDKTNKTDNFL